MEKYNIGEQKKKVCTKCKNELPATTYYFRRHRRCKDGLYTQCKVCCGQKYGIYRTRNYVDRSNEKQGYKICTRCEKQLKLSEYGNEPRNNDGKKSQCVNCFKKTRKEWEERVNHKGNYDPAYQREWHQKNPNYRREVYAKNREAELKRSRRWYEKNKDTKEYRERARRESHIWRQRINNSS